MLVKWMFLFLYRNFPVSKSKYLIFISQLRGSHAVCSREFFLLYRAIVWIENEKNKNAWPLKKKNLSALLTKTNRVVLNYQFKNKNWCWVSFNSTHRTIYHRQISLWTRSFMKLKIPLQKLFYLFSYFDLSHCYQSIYFINENQILIIH